jgi:Holliday junction resolvase RusA-like endonuclease
MTDWTDEPIKLTIKGKPIALKRPRFGNKRAYDPQKKEKERWILEAKTQIQVKPTGKPVFISIDFKMPIPKNFKKTDINLIKTWGYLYYHSKRPDLDNLIKFVKDCLTGVLWLDDSQVVSLFASKYYSTEPATEIIVQAESDD